MNDATMNDTLTGSSEWRSTDVALLNKTLLSFDDVPMHLNPVCMSSFISQLSESSLFLYSANFL
jgi:hypothetical protein